VLDTLPGMPPAISERIETRQFNRKEEAIMKTLRNRLQTAVAVTVLLTGLGAATVAQGFVGGFSSGYGGVRSPLRINGSVVCNNCSLAEVRQAHPQERGFYQFSHKHGQLIFKVASVNDTSTFYALAWPPRLWLSASDEVLRQLSAEENLFKPIGLTGILNTTRTLAVTDIAISG
jgi:hypothetical protein